MAGMIVSSVVTTVALIACAVAALINSARALQAITLATLIGYGNVHLFKQAAASGLLVRLVLVLFFLRVLPTMRGSDVRLVWPIWLFCLLSAITSALASPALQVSIFKILTFGLASTSVLVAFNRQTRQQMLVLQRWFLTVGLTVIGVSALLLLKPSIGVAPNGGLQGTLNQPQALGIFIAPFAAWSIVGVLLMRGRASQLEKWVAVGTLALIVLTRARTGAAAIFIGVGVVMLARMLGTRTARYSSLGRPIAIVLAGFVVLAGLSVATGKVQELATEFAFKGTQKTNRNLGEAFYASRGGGVLQEWRDFLDKPLTGNGFGVYPDGRFPNGVVYVAGIPISAPIEKGFLPTAILQEGGIVGGASLAFLIFWLARHAWRNSDLRWRAMFVACLAMNIGECVLLSPAGIGIIDWLLLVLALSAHRTDRRTVRVASPQPQVDAAAPELAAVPKLLT